MRKMAKLKLVTRMSFVRYAIETSTNFLYHIEQKRDVYDRYGKEGLTGGKTKFDRKWSGHDKCDFENKLSCFGTSLLLFA